MKHRLSLILLICAITALDAFPQQTASPSQNLVHVATALDHLTVLEFHEPVIMAAAGSTDFQIERQEDKVFIKPTKSGATTDLFIWTASRRFAYELDTTQELKNMNVSIDNPLPASASSSASQISPHAEEIADMMLTRALLRSVEITPSNSHIRKGEVCVRVQQVFRTRTTLYVHYLVENVSKRAYHLSAPEARELKAGQSDLLLPNYAHKQVDPRLLETVSDISKASLPVARSEISAEDLGPGQSARGVIAIRQDLDSPAVVELVFDGGIKALFVL